MAQSATASTRSRPHIEVNIHKRQLIVQLRNKIRIRRPDNVHLWQARRADEFKRQVDKVPLDMLRIPERARGVFHPLPGPIGYMVDRAHDLRHLYRVSAASWHSGCTGCERDCGFGAVLRLWLEINDDKRPVVLVKPLKPLYTLWPPKARQYEYCG